METFLNVKIDDDLKRRLNVRAAENGLTQKELVSNIVKAELDGPKEPCVWIYNSDGFWKTACNEAQYFTEGNIKENNHNYCPYCGKKIEEQS